LAVRSSERTALSALAIAKGESLAPPAGVILAVRNAAAIAARHPGSLVVDHQRQRVFRGADRVEMACFSRRTHLFALCSTICCAIGGQVSRSSIADAFYSGDAEGGPLCIESVISKRLCRARPFFRWAGLALKHRYIGGLIEVRATAPQRDAAWTSFGINDHGIFSIGDRP